MCQVRLYLVILVLCLLTGTLNAKILRAGKNKGRALKIVNVTMEQLYSPFRWNIIYVADNPDFVNLDHAFMDFFKDTKKNKYVSYTEAVLNDSTRLTFTCSFRPFKKCFLEECLDEDGNFEQFHDCPLYFIEGKAGYYYRYVDYDVTGLYFPVDTRYIATTPGSTLSDTELQKILQLDASTFGGKLHQLPYKLP